MTLMTEKERDFKDCINKNNDNVIWKNRWN